MKVSIVTVTFNCKDVVESTLLSVINQSYSDFEYIVVDGGSSDGTTEIIKRYQEWISYCVSEPDYGIFDAMNKALNHVSGDYVIFLNAGDRFVADYILFKVFNGKIYDEDLLYGDVFVQNTLGYKLIKANSIYSQIVSAKDLVFKGQGFCHQSLFTKASLLKNIGFDLRFKLGADYDTTAKIYFSGNQKILYLGYPISVFDDRTGGASHNQTKKVLLERASMFSYKIGFYFYYKLMTYLVKQSSKSIMGKVIPKIVLNYRSKKYVTEI